MSLSAPLSANNSPKIPPQQHLDAKLGPLDLDALLEDPTAVLKGLDTYVAKAKTENPKLADQQYAQAQEKLGPQKLSFFKNAKAAYDKGFLTTSKNSSENKKMLTSAAEDDGIFADQTIKKMTVHEQLTSKLKPKREVLNTQAQKEQKSLVERLKGLSLKPKFK